MSLDSYHAYYYQVQLRMKLSTVDFCDFVVWSKISAFVSTDKLQSLVIGHFAKPSTLATTQPSCFGNSPTLMVKHELAKNAWITSEIFKLWLTEVINGTLKRSNEKVLLFIDTFSAHTAATCTMNSTSIAVAYFQPYATSVLQLVDQGIIRSLK